MVHVSPQDYCDGVAVEEPGSGLGPILFPRAPWGTKVGQCRLVLIGYLLWPSLHGRGQRLESARAYHFFFFLNSIVAAIRFVSRPNVVRIAKSRHD